MATPMFVCQHTLSRHTKPINVLKISKDVSLLLSGGDDGLLVIWNISAGCEHQTISVVFNGSVSACAWTPPDAQNSTTTFAFGCADGTIFVYHRRPQDGHYDFAFSTNAFDSPIECISYDPHHRRIAAVGKGTLKIWDMSSNGHLILLESTPPRACIARCAKFFEGGNMILVCYTESHEVIGYQVSPWSMKWSQQLPTRIGHAAIGADNQSLIVSNLLNGVNVYTIPPQHPVRSFQHPIARNVFLTVVSALDGALTLVGSNDGSPCLFDHRTGTVSSVLMHSKVGTLVQSVAAHSQGNHCILVTASTDTENYQIKTWIPSQEKAFVPLKLPAQSSTFSKLQICQILSLFIICQLGLIALLIYIYIGAPKTSDNFRSFNILHTAPILNKVMDIGNW